jgi:dihydropteroate synthase
LQLECGDKLVDLDTPRVMGVLNVTPDSFSDGGRFTSLEIAVAHAVRMVEEGAALVDVGGESTRPGAQAVGADEELQRVIPVVQALVARLPVPVSVDTGKPEVMREALRAGAGMINDVYGFRHEGSLEVLAGSRAALCVMHMQGEPRTMQKAPHYSDVVAEVNQFLGDRVDECRRHGIDARRIVIDPGFGFGKTLEHNLALLAGLEKITQSEVPVLVGLSRKSMLGTITGRPVDDRVHAGAAAAAIAVLKGARLVRTHDVAATVDAVRIATAVARGEHS